VDECERRSTRKRQRQRRNSTGRRRATPCTAGVEAACHALRDKRTRERGRRFRVYKEAPGFRPSPRDKRKKDEASLEQLKRECAEEVETTPQAQPPPCAPTTPPARSSAPRPPCRWSSTARGRTASPRARDPGLTLVHFSAQLEPCLTQENTLHTLNTPLTRAT